MEMEQRGITSDEVCGNRNNKGNDIVYSLIKIVRLLIQTILKGQIFSSEWE